MVEVQKALSVLYDGLEPGTGYRMDILVENRIVLELKAVKETTPVDMAQLLTYMRLSEVRSRTYLSCHFQLVDRVAHRGEKRRQHLSVGEAF